eukprot:scaffold2280_cov430-Prasinococcus_capsulatus_cf.AAC.25
MQSWVEVEGIATALPLLIVAQQRQTISGGNLRRRVGVDEQCRLSGASWFAGSGEVSHSLVPALGVDVTTVIVPELPGRCRACRSAKTRTWRCRPDAGAGKPKHGRTPIR